MRKNVQLNVNCLPGPDDIVQSVTENGIRVLVRVNKVSPSISIKGYVKNGSMLDPDDKLGLAMFTAFSLIRGTKKLSFQEIYNDLESTGANLGFSAGAHSTSFSGRALAEDLPLLLRLISGCLREPVFPEKQVERLRAQWLSMLAIRAQDTGEMASLTFDELIFPGHPYGRPEEGYTNTIQKITREDLVNFQAVHYAPASLVLVVVGGVDSKNVVNLVQDNFGDWHKPQIIPGLNSFQNPRLEQPIRKHVDIAGKSQTDLVMGCLGPTRRSPDYIPATIGNNVLGQFGMMGRIGEAVRERAGLAYYAGSGINAWNLAGTWEVSAGVNPVNLERAIELIKSELRRFVEEPVSEQELDDCKTNMIGRLPLSLESNEGVAVAILNMERYQLGMDYIRRYPEVVDAVTISKIQETARRYINPDHLVTVSAGSR